MEKSFLAFIEQSIKKNWDLDALTDYKGATLQYKDLARKIEKLHILLEESGVRPGDKVAICGRNSSHWGVAFLATLTYGAIAVPILHEFKADTIHNIVNHSDARLLFVGDMAWESLNEAEMPLLEGIILMTDFTLLVCRSKQLEYAREHLNEMFGRKFPRNFRREHVSYRRDTPEELAIINYTSGTTSFSKGVMLPYRSLWSNTQFAFEVLPLQAGNRVVSMLPMAHMYGLAFEFLYEICCGCHVYFLTRMPSPKIIAQAFTDVKPHIVIAVPLIIEKIIKKGVLPKMETLKMKMLMKLPIIGRIIFDSDICRFSTLASTLFASGVNTTEAFRLAEKAVKNADMRSRFQSFRTAVNDGAPISAALQRYGLLENEDIDIISVGERTGSLVGSFAEINKAHTESLNKRIKTATTALGGVALGLAFALVFVFAMGIVLSILGLSQSMVAK